MLYFFNIYGTTSSFGETLDNITSDCQSIAIPYIPFYLTHTRLVEIFHLIK